ncbi:hypothetical protein N7540_002720 [Penicillium herquei]|nr:hypothetical protein N7540_002720 [Penicillium herquei]
MFMLEMYKRLDPSDSQKSPWLFENQAVNGLRRRIRETCKGHLDWIFNLDLDAACSTNLWISGKRIDSYSETSVPKNCPTNMPYHIIKVTEFLRVVEDFVGKEPIYQKLAILCKGWFSRLKTTKNIRTPTWEHVEGSDIPSYRLGDHIWIWKALKGVEDLMNEMGPQSANGSIYSDERQQFLKLKDRISTLKAERLRGHADEDEETIFFNAEDLRKENLKRFTIKNEIFNRRMLSVTRSASETRFLFHSRDTVLCYGMGWNFFKSHDEPLRELMNVQTKHDDILCEESYWKNPLRYGLALLMSREDCQLESMYSPDRMEQHARKLLLSSSSENGLFPGQLNDDKQAMLFEDEIDRDFYFHVGFEIPYILLRCQRPKKVQQLDPAEDVSSENPLASDQSAPRDSRPQNEQNYSNRNVTNSAIAPMTLKRQIPYGVFVDVNKIVDVAEEWLFKDPDFLGFTPPQEQNEINGTIIAASHRLGLEYEMVWDDMKLMEGRHSAIMLDIRKSRKRKLTAQQKCTVVKVSRDHLLAKRRLDESKKRLINIKCPKWNMAIACYVATPECDRSNLASFFQRHGNTKSSFFHDDVVIGFNTWTTELHCRFFRAVEKYGDEWKELQKQRSAAGLDVPVDQKCSRQLAAKLCQTLGHGCYIVDDVFSFMMVGDWCDRYWTCHVLETSTVRSDLFRTEWRDSNPHFPQRKVLELILFNNVLENIHRSAIDILKRVERDPRSSSSDISEELYSNVSFKDKKQELLDETFQVLRILKDSITGIKDLIEDWKQRESSQGRERPRWTRSDEQRYRKIIQTHDNELAKHDREINLFLSRIDFLIALVNNEKSLSQSRDVTRFTYATVFFLPVGLAVSLFSMSGAPGRAAVLEVVITAIVALSVTVFILWSAIKAPTSINTRRLPVSFSWLVQKFSAYQRKYSAKGDGEETSLSNQRSPRGSLRNRLFGLSNLKQRNSTKDSHSESAA